jgi:hypothetical protein
MLSRSGDQQRWAGVLACNCAGSHSSSSAVYVASGKRIAADDQQRNAQLADLVAMCAASTRARKNTHDESCNQRRACGMRTTLYSPGYERHYRRSSEFACWPHRVAVGDLQDARNQGGSPPIPAHGDHRSGAVGVDSLWDARCLDRYCRTVGTCEFDSDARCDPGDTGHSRHRQRSPVR